MEQEKLPWSWREKVLNFLKPDSRLLDLSPCGELFLRSLSHPAALCTEMRQGKKLTFPDNKFDLILNDGGEYDLSEVCRVLKSGGFFLTQQYGSEHCAAFLRRFLGDACKKGPDFNLENQMPKFEKMGFRIMYRNQAYPICRFSDGEQLWDYLSEQSPFFPGLLEKEKKIWEQVQKEIDTRGFLELEEHRFIIIAKKR
ncbi:MAG: hypothetical protein J1E06_02855 [Acutalibacter sp.]|nr:hypothetical protein [Acutalibacter sp.]